MGKMEMNQLNKTMSSNYFVGYQKNEKAHKKALYVFICLTFLVMLFLNFNSGYHSDDYGYALRNTSSIIDLSIEYYKEWSGRFPATILIYFFLDLPKGIFNVVNAAMFTAFTVLIYFHCINKKEVKPALYLLVTAACWIINPVFHETVLWLTGTITYLWTFVGILLCLLPYKLYGQGSFEVAGKKKYVFAVMMFLSGLIAGWGMENASGGCILFILIMLGYYYFKTIKFQLWHFSGLIGSIIGFLLLVLAPGNALRSETKIQENSFLIQVVYSFRSITEYLIDNYLFVIILFVLLAIIIICDEKAKKITLPMIYFIVSMATFYCMALSPVIPERSYFGACVFLTIAVVGMLSSIEFSNVTNKKIVCCIMAFICLYTASIFFTETINITRAYNIYQKREVYIEAQKEIGNLEITIPALPDDSTYAPKELLDLEWIEGMFCEFYNIDSVTLIPYEDWTDWEQQNSLE